MSATRSGAIRSRAVERPDRAMVVAAHPDDIEFSAAIYPSACTRLAFPELLDEGLEPHRVEEVYLTMTRAADHWIDIGATLEAKLAAWRENRSQIVVPGEVEAAIRCDAQQAAGAVRGIAYAEAFTYFRLGTPRALERVRGTHRYRAGDRRRNGGRNDGRATWGRNGHGYEHAR